MSDVAHGSGRGTKLSLPSRSMTAAVSETPELVASPHDQPDQRALLIALGAAVFMVNLDGRVIAPLLPTLSAELGVSIARAGWLVSAYMVPYGLFQLSFGPLADRYGKVTVCTHALLAFSVGTACCGLWPSFVSIFILRALTGAAAAGLIPLTLAYIGDTVPYERRQATIATLMASGGAAQALGTAAGGSIAALFSWRAVFPCLGVLSGAVCLALYALKHHEVRLPRCEKPSYATVLSAPRMRGLLALVATEGFLYFGTFSYLSGLLEARFALDALAIGCVLALSGVSQLVTARLLPRLIGRIPERVMLGAGAASMGLAYLMSAFSPAVWVVAAACVIAGVGWMLCHTTLQTYATEVFPSARGTALAFFAFSLFLGSGIGAVVQGALLERAGITTSFALAGAGLCIFACVVQLLAVKRKAAS
jgi:predicted MFS family arabinose efflux permease